MFEAFIITAAIVAPFLLVAILYNSLVVRRNQIENAFGGIEVQLKKRYSLIPNLIATVKQYMRHEQKMLAEITRLRTKALRRDSSSDEKVRLNNEISQSLRSILVSVEDYPELKSNRNFIQLQNALNEVEAQIAAARRLYNSNVTYYNNGVETFPSNLVAGLLGFQRKKIFEATAEERREISVGESFLE